MKLWPILLAVLLLSGCQYRTLGEAGSTRVFHVAHSLTAAAAFDRSEVWISETFVSARAVIDVRQPGNGLLIGKGHMRVQSTSGMVSQPIPIDLTMRIENADHTSTLRIRAQSPYGDDVQMEESDTTAIMARVDAMAPSFAAAMGGSLVLEK